MSGVTSNRCSARRTFGELYVDGSVSLIGVSASRLCADFRLIADWTPA